jgi:hypothetical protein
MRSRNEWISPRGWPSLRRVLFAALALVVALPGGVPTPVAAQNQSVSVGMMVFFSPYTQPPLPGQVCKNKDYVIFADPTVDVGGVDMDDFYDHNALVRVSGTGLGTIGPNPYLLGPAGGPARFTYRAGNTGQETLRFTAEITRPVTYQIDGRETLIQKVDETFRFEVVECPYKVSFGLAIQVAQSGLLMVQFGLMNETPIKVKEDDTVEGSGSFEFTTIIAQPYCIWDSEDFKTVPRITGKLLPDSHELELTFDYGTGTWKTGGSCSHSGVTVGVPSRSETWELSPALPRTVKFRDTGEIRSFPINIGPARGTLRIAVEPGSTQ